jgi:hypothetical protein
MSTNSDDELDQMADLGAKIAEVRYHLDEAAALMAAAAEEYSILTPEKKRKLETAASDVRHILHRLP